jgi:ribosomal protein L4
MADFILTPLNGRGWQGAKAKDITVKVMSNNIAVAIQSAVCSSANPQNLTIKQGGSVIFQLVSGAQVLTVAITQVFPIADWSVVEVDPAGNTQELAGVLASQNLPDPFSLSINLQGN